MSRRKKFRSLVPRHRPNPYRNRQVKLPAAPTPNDPSARKETDHPCEPVTSFEIVPYDENLLERSRTLWRLGDWASLTKLDRDALQSHPDRAKLALLAAAGHLQASSPGTAAQFIRLAQDWGCSKRMLGQVLVAGVYNTLGKASLMANDQQRALAHYKTAASVANQKANSGLLAETLAMHERARLDAACQARSLLPPVAPELHTPAKPDVGIASYAQNFEDVMLWRALGRVKNGFYIDVGAHDPVADSVSKAFYDHGWRGIHVEPLPEYAESLRQARPDERVVEAVLAAQAGTLTFYHIPKTGLSTGAKEFAKRHQNNGWQVNEITVPAITLASLFDEVGDRQIHWLKIDVEGMEAEVLDGWGVHLARPWVVVVEATEPNSQTLTSDLWEDRLFSRNYQRVYFDGLNCFYLSKDKIGLKELLSVPPNIFDDFKRV